MKKVNIKIKGGNISADFTGFKGNACERLDEKIRPQEMDDAEKELKPEYYQQQSHIESETNEW